MENADEGIISFVISTTTEQSHAVCLNIIAKNSVPENAETAIKGTDYFTNINSNYFPVIVTTKTISGIQVESTNSTVSSIYYNKEASKIDYKAGVALKARFVDGGNATLDPENVDLYFESKSGKIHIFGNGVACDYSEEEATKILSDPEVTALVDMHMGDAEATAWGCDLSYDYVKINADYRS